MNSILALIGGALIGLSITGHNVVDAVGLPFDKQLYLGLLYGTVAFCVHVAGGGRAWPFGGQGE